MPQDKIILEGMVFYGYHGVSPEEKARGQRFVVDVELTTDLTRAGGSDDLKDTVDYSEVYRLVKAVIEGRRRDLIEALAQEISSHILSEYRVEEVKVRVKKPQVSIKGSILSGAAVEIVRKSPPARGAGT